MAVNVPGRIDRYPLAIGMPNWWLGYADESSAPRLACAPDPVTPGRSPVAPVTMIHPVAGREPVHTPSPPATVQWPAPPSPLEPPEAAMVVILSAPANPTTLMLAYALLLH
jgi:hypothetical protein